MKLKNKKTGEIIEHALLSSYGISGDVVVEFMDENAENGYSEYGIYHTLAELNSEWEDYEEAKGKWFISNNGQIHNDEGHERYREERKLIGNYFSSREEAEKAVEKLKAWKRLKDKGFKFQFWTSSYSGDNISFFIDWINADSKKEIEKDLDLLFGGEE